MCSKHSRTQSSTEWNAKKCDIIRIKAVTARRRKQTLMAKYTSPGEWVNLAAAGAGVVEQHCKQRKCS